VCLGLAVISFVLSRNVFDPVMFGRRAADSLSDPAVAVYAADLITGRMIQRKPDLIAFRPMLLSATETVVSNKAFRSVVEQAAVRAHRLAFSEASQRVLLSLPDLNVLVRDALSNASPSLAAKIPKSLDSTIARLAGGKTATIVLDLARAGKALRRLWPFFFASALGLHILALWLAADRRQAMAHAGFGLIVLGLLLAAIVFATPLAGLWIHDAKELGLVRGLWHTYFGDLARWGFLIAGLGVLIVAGAASLLDRIDPFDQLSRIARILVTPPGTPFRRFLWGLALLLGGCIVISYPIAMLSCAAVVIGVCLAYAGSRELFRLFLDTLETLEEAGSGVQPALRRRRIIPAMISLLVLILGGVWVVWRNPTTTPVRAAPAVFACNGFPQLCDRTIDQVVFAGAHNAMSNQDAPGWMFPHHEAGMPQMLRDGIRALLVDVHYGFAGGARIKTDMRMEPTTDKIKQSIGAEGYAAAMRIRDRLVGVDESKRGLYFCHGFCELGAYPVEPALQDIRDFVVAHPDEVIIIIVEDAVMPVDLASEFEKAGFDGLIYTGAQTPHWPTLRELIESGKRILLFTESGRPGVPWLRPAFATFRETPYTFHKAEDFSCRANRGGDAGPLFQINNWIDTTPTPKPSNAAIVNAYPFLLARAERCAEERHHLPNLIAVDFYKTGNLFAVVDKLNGVEELEEKESESSGNPSAQVRP
jgi:hypothetical protein